MALKLSQINPALNSPQTGLARFMSEVLVWRKPVSYGRPVPASPREHVTTEELLAVTGSTRDTLYEWVAKRLLPRPRIETGPGGEQFAVWPVEALERVRFIVATCKRMGIDEVVALVEERWPRR